MTDGSAGPPPPAAPPGVAALFGERLGQAEAFVAILADTGVSHGLIGPREVPRLWERHVLNCAAIADSFPVGATVIDVGSGAGLPGLAVAIARPDLTIHLVEPMQRRVAWLADTTSALGLTSVTIHRSRAEELAGRLAAPWVTARAVARLGTLARWCRPLLVDGGTLVAMKGSSAEEELTVDRPELERLGLVAATVTHHGSGIVDPPPLTVDLTFGPMTAARKHGRAAAGPVGRGGRGGSRRHPRGRGRADE